MDDELYRVPLAEFTKTRDAIAARLSAAGQKDAAAELKRVKKPSIPAWAANQVVWRAPDAWRRLREAAKAMRRAYQKAPSPDEVREATREQRDALAACEARASEVLAQHGHAATPAVLEKVGHTLLTLAYGAPHVTPGRLETDLPPPGFEALAGLTLAPPPRRQVPATAEPREEREAEPPAEAGRPTEADRKRAAAESQRTEEDERARRLAALRAAEARQAESRRTVVKARARLEGDEQRVRALEDQLQAARSASQDARRLLEAAEAEDRAAAAAVEALRQEEAPAG